ncbi:hypothetical protein CHUAL_013838 [Chamberlinius hualienensis]
MESKMENDSERDFLKELEKAKVLSLETLETDRLRRERKYSSNTSFGSEVRFGSQRGYKKSNSITGSSSYTGNTRNIKSTENEENKLDSTGRYRPRAGPTNSTGAPALPPPPRRQASVPSNQSVTTSSVSTTIPDLMTFSSPDNTKGVEPEFDPLLSSSISEVTFSPLIVSNFNTAFPVCFPSLPQSTTVPVMPPLPSLQTPMLTTGPLPLSHWNFPPPYTISPQLPVAPSPVSNAPSASSVMKAIEKQQNGNLIDFSAYERVWLPKENDKRKSIDRKDLLSSFDPLLSQSETVFVKEPQPQLSASQQQIEPVLKNQTIAEPQGITDTSTETVQIRSPERLHSQRSLSQKIRRNKVYQSVKILSEKRKINQELTYFKDSLVSLRRRFTSDDHLTNVGMVISSTLDSLHEGSISVKLAIYSVYTEKPVCFACDVTTSVEHVISQFMCSIYDDISNINSNHYSLKVHGRSEFLSFESSLVDYEFVHRCHEYNEDVRLTALNSDGLERPLARTAEDDENDVKLEERKLLPLDNVVNEKSILILIENLENEMSRLKKEANNGNANSLQVNGALQSVKLICAKMAQVETKDLRDAIDELNQVTNYFTLALDTSTLSSKHEASVMEEIHSRTLSDCLNFLPRSPFTKMQLLNLVLEKVKIAVNNLIQIYCRCFYVDYPLPELHPPSHSIKDVASFTDTLLVSVASVHRIPAQWISNYESFIVSCEVYHGIRLLVETVETNRAQLSTGFYQFIKYEQWVEITGLLLCILPKESRLCFTLYGLSTVTSDGESHQVKTALCWAALPLFNFNGELSQGRFFCGMWSDEIDKRLGPAVSNTGDQHCPVIQLDLPDFGCAMIFPPVIRDLPHKSQMKEFEMLDSRTQQVLLDLVERCSTAKNVVDERETLWQMRHYLYEIPQALPKVLLAAHSWNWSCLSDIYKMLDEWKPMNGVDALELLLPCFPDFEVRRLAVSWIRSMSSDELCDYLPQLVQALKYETYDSSALADFLIERSLASIRVMHHLYWLLRQNLDDRRYGKRMLLIFNSLVAVAGKAMRNHFDKQESLVNRLSKVATKVKESKDGLRMSVLLSKLDLVKNDLSERSACLPLGPSLEVCSLELKACSYLTSKTTPLRISFLSRELGAQPIEAIFKIGDDLRQDMLTLQMLRIMDKLWLKEGLNLQIVTFGCIPTALQQGIVEVVTGAETLGKIQKEHGLTGPFKDHPIAEWLQKFNTTEQEYIQAVEKFTHSCAGYCVATYILGICDRHNDNIMIKPTGHLFHIDFGKFLGDSETFGGLKRDRVPFVLTSDMAFVINGGDRPSDKFQHFVDLCCQAFNIIRKNGNLFLNLFALMVSAGIPGVTVGAVSYIQKALIPDLSECEAAIAFTRMIEDSLKSWFTQFNFFIHNLAQLKFSSEHNSDSLLSFVPRNYTMESDGKIQSVDVIGYEKHYEPEKYYVYILRVTRESQTEKTYLRRSYREFGEFHHKLCTSFPLAKYRSLPKVYIGRSNVRHVAEKRKVEIEFFINSLWKMADEIKHCDLVYTFLHSLLRDLQEQNGKDRKESLIRPLEGLITGSIKLSIHYKNDTLFVMVVHAKNLNEVKNQPPDTYVKTYLVPDPSKSTKRKTKTIYRNCHPTYMEMMTYPSDLETVKHRILQVSVWHHGIMSENTFLGAVAIRLNQLTLKVQTTNWYQLGNVEKLLQR